MAWKVGAIHDTSDFIGFNIIDATSERPIVSFSYSSCDEATIMRMVWWPRRLKMPNTSAWSRPGR